jgi:DNA-binding CsgD family transcriptional regulator
VKAGRAGNASSTIVRQTLAEPVVAHSGDPRSRPGGANRLNADGQRLHERREELAEVRHLLGGTWEYPKCPVVIEGLAGTGKTALLNASLEIGRDLGLRIGRARCDATESTASFGVVRQLFSSMFRQQTMPDGPMNDGTDLARRLLRGGLSATDDPIDAFHSLLLLLESTGDEAVLLGVDDVQWADAASAEWLQFLARRLTTSSVHLVMTTRARRAGRATATDPLVSDASTRRFVMHPLTIESTTSMIDQHLAADVTPRIATRAHQVTGGNPLLIARMLTALDEVGGVAITEDQIESLSSPVVARSVMSLVSTLPAGALELLEAAAVLGEGDLRVAAAVAQLENDDAGRLADVLADVGLLGWGRPLDFVHTFERHSVYASIKPARRARLHTRAAQVLAGLGAEAGIIAGHLLESEPSGDEWTTSVLVASARQDLESGDLVRATRLLERADREAPENPLHAEVVRFRAQVDGRLGRSTAVDHLGRAARLGLAPVSLAETALDLLDHQRDHSSCAAILEMVQPARAQLVEQHPLLALRLQLAESVLLPSPARALLAAPRDVDGDLAASPAGHLLAAQQALRAAARLECTHDQLIDTMRSLLTPDLLSGGGLVQTAVIAASLGALVRIGAFATADPLIRSAMTEAQLAGRRRDSAAYTLVHAESLAMQGRVLAAEQAVAAIASDADDVVGQCAAMQARFFAALRERSGHDPIAITVPPTTLAPGLAELGASTAMILAETTARVQLLEGDPASALITFDRLRAAAEQAGVRNPSFAPWRAGRSNALGALAKRKEGASVAGENLQLARAFGSPITVAEALACNARFQPANAQVELLNEALGLVAGTQAELLRCNLLIDLGFARHYAGDAAAARTAFRDGADHATRLGVTRLAGVAGRGLLACGARPRRLQTSGLQSLTPAELRVVKLAADGQTNGAIATSLFINLKTVESHLTRAYRKLGIADRAELKAALVAHESSEVDTLDISEAG